MSSTKWRLTQQGFSSPTTKRTASSQEFSICSIVDSSSSSEAEEDEEDTEHQSQFDIWSSIQDDAYKKKKQQLDENKSQFDMWSSLIQQQKPQQEPLPPPYIHPLVKRSASSLSKKSLEICTESLGSETGSACFSSSYPASESGDATEEDVKETDPEQEEERVVEQSFENLEQEEFIPKYDDNYYVAAAAKKSSPQRSFPPPIPSCCLNGASSFRMQSRRDNGRLVLEAVSVPFTNNFLAQRQDGRLVLTLSTEILKTEQEEEEEENKEVEEELEEVFESLFDDEDNNESDEVDEESEDGIKEAAFVMEHAPKFSWPNKFNDVVRFDEVEEDTEPAMVAKSLPPMARLIPKSPAAAAATGTAMTTATLACRGGGGGGGGASFNAYEYYRRPKSMTTQSEGNKNSIENNGEQQNLLVLRGNKGDSLVPLVKSCKEPRRSLLCWEPYCIATS